MKNSWSKEDRLHYNNSEVMKELENIVLSTVSRLDLITKKSADAAETKARSDAQKDLNVQLERTNDLQAQSDFADDAQAASVAEYSDEDIAKYLMSDEYSEGKYKGYNGANGPHKASLEAVIVALADGGAYHDSKALIAAEMKTAGVAPANTDESADSHTVIIQDNQANDEEVKEAALEELGELVILAIEKGDYKLAYKIERTMDEIAEEEVLCEL
mgnify:CR=1 FL=1